MPPSEAPGPTGVAQTMLPLSGLSAQKMPLFWPKPTMLPTRFGPDPPKSKSGLVGTGQFAFGPVGVMQASVQVSKPCSRLAVRQRSRVLASFYIWGSGVVVPRAHEERAALWINHRRLPNRSAAISSCLPAIVRHVEGLPENRAGLHIQRHNTAAKTAAWIRRVQCQGLFGRRNANVNDAVENYRRSSDDCRRMR